MAWSTPSTRSTGDLITAAIWNQDVVSNPIALTPAGLTFILSGGGAVISTGGQGGFRLPLNANLNSLHLSNDEDESGTTKVSLDVDLRRTSNRSAGYPNSTGSIMDSTGLKIESGDFAERTALGGITPTSYTDGDYFSVHVNSASTCKRATLDIDLTRD